MKCQKYNMAASVDGFEPWLNAKLKSLKTDEGVFGSYISGILESEESVEEKKDALEGILSEIVEHDISVHINEIIEKWESCKPKEEAPRAARDMDVQLGVLLDSQAVATTTRREYTDEEKKIREAILSQYSQLSDHGIGDNMVMEYGSNVEVPQQYGDAAVQLLYFGGRQHYNRINHLVEDVEDDVDSDGPDLVKNTNASDVAHAARERREQARLEAQRKKEKDREDREKQKQLKEEKKEKRKTQKGERKR